MACAAAFFTYPVVIAEFRADFLKSYEIPYKMTCVITVGESVTTVSQGVDSLVGSGMSQLTSLVGDVESSVADTFSDLVGPLSDISSSIGTASTLISTAGSLTGVSLGQNSTIISYLQNAQTGIGGAVNIANGNIAAGANQIGGVIPSNPQASAVSLTTNIAYLGNLANLLTARGVAGVTINNVQQAAASPAAVLDAAHVQLDQPVDVREEGGRIIIEPLHPIRYDLATLVAGITNENRHDPVEMDKPAGQEVW